MTGAGSGLEDHVRERLAEHRESANPHREDDERDEAHLESQALELLNSFPATQGRPL